MTKRRWRRRVLLGSALALLAGLMALLLPRPIAARQGAGDIVSRPLPGAERWVAVATDPERWRDHPLAGGAALASANDLACVPLPIVVVPRSDIDAGNEVLGLFLERSAPLEVRLTLVYRDEDHPSLDHAYDAFRWLQLHRLADVETFAYTYAAPDAPPQAIDLTGVYASQQTWSVQIAIHYDAIVPFASFQQREGRPILWANTWNHMLSEKPPAHAAGELVWIEDYPVFRGGRDGCQGMYERRYRDVAGWFRSDPDRAE